MNATKILWGQVLLVSAVVLAFIWAATEWTAWRLAFQPQLGHPWFEVLGWPVYQPPAFFWWWFAYDAYAREIFVKGAYIAASGGIAAIVVAVTLSVWRAREAKKVTTYGSARWAEAHEVRQAGMLGQPDCAVTSGPGGHVMIGLEVEFLPVGEKSRAGDAIAIRYGEPNSFQLIVVDGGTTASGEALMAHLTSICGGAVPVVRDLVITHPDIDHSSGARVVLEKADVRRVWTHVPWWHAEAILPHLQDSRWTVEGLTRRLKSEYDVINEIVATAGTKGIPVFEPFAGAAIGPFTVLSPPQHIYPQLVSHFPDTPRASGNMSDFADQGILKAVLEALAKTAASIWEAWGFERLRDGGETGARNESSVVLYGQFDGWKPILLTGDAGNLGLEWAASFADACGFVLRNFALVQVPHHGSRRNVGPTILDRLIGPVVSEGHVPHFTAVVSAPKDDSAHPRKIVMNAFMRRGARVLGTQGVATCFGSGFPQRAGYGPAAAMNFSPVVEAYDDD